MLDIFGLSRMAGAARNTVLWGEAKDVFGLWVSGFGPKAGQVKVVTEDDEEFLVYETRLTQPIFGPSSRTPGQVQEAFDHWYSTL